jgi:hypothetical protein
MLEAFGWGALASATLLLGAVLAFAGFIALSAL